MIFLGDAGYVLVHFNKAKLSIFGNILTTWFNSFKLIKPVDNIVGLLVEITFFIRGIWLFSKEAILKAGALRSYK